MQPFLTSESVIILNMPFSGAEYCLFNHRLLKSYPEILYMKGFSNFMYIQYKKMMQIRYFFLLILIGFSGSSMAQMPTAAEIKAQKIKKITRQKVGDNSTAGKTEWLYNANGDEIAMYSYGNRSYYNELEYDAKKRIKSIKKFADDGKERETTMYNYKPDGSFTTVNTDKAYGMTISTVYNSKGNPVSETIPDGSIRHSIYNSQGQLIKYYAVPKNDGMEFTNTYKYDKAGKLVSQVNTGEYGATMNYDYDAKKLLKKSTTTVVDEDGNKEITEYEYKYEF